MLKVSCTFKICIVNFPYVLIINWKRDLHLFRVLLFSKDFKEKTHIVIGPSFPMKTFGTVP